MFRCLLAVAVLISSASAQLAPEEAREVIGDVGVSTLVPLLHKAGMTPETATIEDREAVILRSGGQIVILRPRVCNPECVGLHLYTVVRGTPASAVFNRFNEGTAPTTAYAHRGNTVLSRYLIADHGITAGSLMVNVAVFEGTVEKWLEMSRSSNALSVSVSTVGNEVMGADTESEAFLAEVLRRPDLLTENPGAGY